jgi:hypothetical protein
MSDYFDRLEGDLRRAAERPATRFGPVLGWGAPAVAAGVAVAAAALVAVVVLGAGEREAPTIRDGPRGTQPPAIGGRVVATGRTPVAGPWRMSVRRRDCVGITLTRPKPEFIIGAAGFCGPFRLTPGFTRGEFWVPARPRSRERILFGRAPERVSAVVVTAKNGRTIRANLYQGPNGVRGDFYLTVIPLDLVGRVNWLDANGRPGSRGIRVRP